MFLVNSRYPLVTATPKRSGREVLHTQGHTFSRSYGANLPSSLTRVLSSALGCSPCLPVLVYGTDGLFTRPAAFLGSLELPSSASGRTFRLSSLLGVNESPFVPWGPRNSTYKLEPESITWMGYPSPSPLASIQTSRYRNVDLFSIAYAMRPRLRFRLTLSGLTLLRKP